MNVLGSWICNPDLRVDPWVSPSPCEMYKVSPALPWFIVANVGWGGLNTELGCGWTLTRVLVLLNHAVARDEQGNIQMIQDPKSYEEKEDYPPSVDPTNGEQF